MPTSPAYDAYLICATPRTGSTLLCDLLRSTGIAGRPESYFRRPDEPAWARQWGVETDHTGALDYQAYVRAAVAAGSTPNGVFGARVMWGTLDEVVAKLRIASPGAHGDDLALLTGAFGRLRFIHLWRQDQVAQAVSWARAEQTGYWHTGDRVRPGREPRFDFAQIDGLVRTIGEHHAAWERWFETSSVEPYVLRYEELAVDPTGATRGVLDFLGLRLPAGRTVDSRRPRQADQLSDDWITRYRALAVARLEG